MGIFFKSKSEKLYHFRRKIISRNRDFEIIRKPKILEAYKNDGSYKIYLMLHDRLGSVSETHTVGNELEFKELYKIGQESFGSQISRPPKIDEGVNKESFVFSGKMQSTYYTLEAILDYEIRDELCNNYIDTRKLQIISSGGQISNDSKGKGFEVTVKDEGHLHVMIQDGVLIETKKSFTLENYNQTKNDLEAELNHSPIRILKEHEEVPMLKWNDVLIGGVAIRFIVKLANQ